MRKATADKRRGIRWNFTTVLKDLDFADDIALLSSKFKGEVSWGFLVSFVKNDEIRPSISCKIIPE